MAKPKKGTTVETISDPVKITPERNNNGDYSDYP